MMSSMPTLENARQPPPRSMESENLSHIGFWVNSHYSSVYLHVLSKVPFILILRPR